VTAGIAPPVGAVYAVKKPSNNGAGLGARIGQHTLKRFLEATGTKVFWWARSFPQERRITGRALQALGTTRSGVGSATNLPKSGIETRRTSARAPLRLHSRRILEICTASAGTHGVRLRKSGQGRCGTTVKESVHGNPKPPAGRARWPPLAGPLPPGAGTNFLRIQIGH